MQTKHFVIIGVVVLLWIGFIVFRGMKKEEDLASHHQETYGRIVAMAKKSPRAGLAQMAKALKHYYADNQTYPEELHQLYPRYLPSKALIDEIDWRYEPGADDFLLTKITLHQNREMVASIGKDLRPRLETDVMVAARGTEPADEPSGAVQEGFYIEAPKAPPASKLLAKTKDTGARVAAARTFIGDAAEVVAVDRFEAGARKKDVSVEKLGDVKMTLLSSTLADDVADAARQYLVWKKPDGALGFGNVSYPMENQLSLARSGRWYRIEKTPAPAPAAAAERPPADPKMRADQLASSLSSQYLVWKDPAGVLGFGNVSFPKRSQLAVSSGDSWYHLHRRPAAAESPPVQKEAADIAEHLADDYLVWRDAAGRLGVGNYTYPRQGPVDVYTGRRWARKESPEPPSSRAAVPPGGGDAGDRSMLYRRSELVWQDKSGALGFGNLALPPLENLSEVYDSGQWRPVTPQYGREQTI